jgi:hypothetical protein
VLMRSGNVSNQRTTQALTTTKRRALAQRRRGDPKYFRCGRPVAQRDIQEPYVRMHECPLRVVWGGNSMGLCQHLPGRPCIYLTILRHPVQRLVSQYNYVCVRGMEGRKDWTPEWRRKNRCDIGIIEFLTQTNITSRNFLHERLTRSCHGNGCAANVAKANLRNPCMRYLLLDKLEDGLTRLKGLLGDGLAPFFDDLLSSQVHDSAAADTDDLANVDHSRVLGDVDEETGALAGSNEGPQHTDLSPPPRMSTATKTTEASPQRNRTPYAKRTMDILEDPKMMARLAHELRHDVDLYEYAVKEYDAQWTRPLVSCNPL